MSDQQKRLRCVTADGLAIALTDFGGAGPDLLLVHATGFCAAVLEPLAQGLTGAFRCWGLDLRGHGHSDRPADGNFAWSGFALDVLAAIDHLGLRQPFAVGHSCGGASVLLAEEARPGTFGGLYCFEPVVFPIDDPGGGAPMDNPLALGARNVGDLSLPGGRPGQLQRQASVQRARPRRPGRLRRGWVRARAGRGRG